MGLDDHLQSGGKLSVSQLWRLSLCATLAVGGVVAAGQAAAETRITTRGAAETSMTDNVLGSRKGTEESDVFATVSPGISVANQGGRSRLNFDYDLSVDRYRDHDELNTERHSFTGVGRLEPVRDYVTLDTNAVLTRLTSNRNGAVAAGDRDVGNNQVDTFVYSFGPTFRYGFGSWAESTASYDFSQTVFDPFGQQTDQAVATGDTISHQINYSIVSGRRFSVLGWSFNNSFTRTEPDSNANTTSFTSSIGLDYTINRYFTATSSIGYESFDGSGTGDDFSGQTWTLGARVTPGPRSSFNFEFGRQNDDKHFQGDATFRVTPSMNLVFSASHQLQLAQAQVANRLQFLTVNDDGQLIDSRTGQPFNLAEEGGDLTEINNVTRSRRLSLALTGVRGRNNYGLTSSWNRTTTASTGRETTTVATNASFGRELSPYMSLSMSAGINGTDDSTGSDSNTISASAGLSFRIRENVTGSTLYTLLRRNSDDPTVELQENTISARVQIVF